MRNNVRYLLHLALVLVPASFMSSKSVPATTPILNTETAVEAAPGGAYVLFAGKFGGEITRNEIANNSEVKVDGCAKGSRIFQFTLSISKNGKTSVLKGQSNLLTGEMTTKLKSLSKGDSFEFKHTKAYLPNGSDVVDVVGKKFVVV